MKKLTLLMGLFIVLLCKALPSQLFPADLSLPIDAPEEAQTTFNGLSVVEYYQVDYCSGSSIGEDNGYLDPGETGSLIYTLQNDFPFSLTEVRATIISLSQNAIVLHDKVDFPDIPAGGMAASKEPFWVQCLFYDYVGQDPQFSLHVEATQGSWDIPAYAFGCGWFGEPLRKTFEVWPLRDWKTIGDPNLGGWKSNEDWGHPNLTGGNSYGLCAEGISMPNESGTWQELRSRIVYCFGSMPWILWYQSNFQGQAGGGMGYVEMSTNEGSTWTIIGVKSTDDPPGGYYTVHYVPLPANVSEVIFRFRLYSGTEGADWQIDGLATWFLGGPQGPPPDVCVPCTCNTPDQPQLSAPHNGALGLGNNVLLRWDRADGAQSYEVYLGSEGGELALQGTTANTSFRLTGLAPGTRYDWMISAVNDCGSAESRVWSFATASGEDEDDDEDEDGDEDEEGHGRPVTPP